MPMLTRQQGGGNKTATTSFINVSKNNNNNNNNDDSEIISMDYTTYPPPASGGREHHAISLSKKGLHQRDADENLFLRFLELDPPGEVSAALSAQVPTSGNAASGSSANRPPLSKPLGRTPFTVTKKLTRTVERGFGFSIVWTHPPRVEKTEPGLPADRSGILPGDYVIFVEKHNVVTMPEADVLNLIRSQGNTLTLEIFRRPGSGLSNTQIPPALSATARAAARSAIVASSNTNLAMNGRTSRIGSTASNYGTMTDDEFAGTVGHTLGPAASSSQCGTVGLRPSTACSVTSSVEAAKRRLNLPQVTFSKESISPITDNRRRFLLQLISREQNFISALHFGMHRFVQPLQERKDLISPNDHRTLFQNIDELLRISEDILEQLCNDEQEAQMSFASRVYLSKTTAICAAYKKYWNGIKRADCVLVNKSRQTSSEFIHFITEPQVPRKRPDLCMLIHRPLQHFREILKLMQLLSSHCHVDSEEHKNFTSVIVELQAAYREITVSSGLMEPLGEGRPLLTLQDLESRMVFTKCKPFTLAVQGRQWIFGGDLSRIEGRSVKPYWTLLFSDIIVFAKVSRDRVLFITEEPIPIANIVDSCFHMRKKTTEFRLTVDPNGRLAESPTGYCAPDLTRTPKKNARRKSLMLRAPSLELKAVWQNLLQRQIFLVNAALGSTPLSSPLDSPDVLNTLVPLSDIGVVSASIGSIKLSSMDSINLRNQQQVRLLHSKQLSIGDSYENLQRLAYTLASSCSTRMTHTSNTSCSSQTASPAHFPVPVGDSMLSLRSLALGRRHMHHQLEFGSPLAQRTASANNSSAWLSLSGSSINTQSQLSGLLFASGSGEYFPAACKCLTAIPEAAGECLNVQESLPFIYHKNCGVDNDDGKSRKIHTCPNSSVPSVEIAKVEATVSVATPNGNVGTSQKKALPKLHEFSLNSVGRSFIDDSNGAPSVTDSSRNISDSTDKSFDGFSNDFVLHKKVSQESKNMGIPLAQFGGSWDLLELDLNLHEVNMDPCFDTDVEECIFMGDERKCGGDVDGNGDVDDDNDNFLAAKMTVSDPFGVLPTRPTPPDSLEL